MQDPASIGDVTEIGVNDEADPSSVRPNNEPRPNVGADPSSTTARTNDEAATTGPGDAPRSEPIVEATPPGTGDATQTEPNEDLNASPPPPATGDLPETEANDEATSSPSRPVLANINSLSRTDAEAPVSKPRTRKRKASISLENIEPRRPRVPVVPNRLKDNGYQAPKKGVRTNTKSKPKPVSQRQRA